MLYQDETFGVNAPEVAAEGYAPVPSFLRRAPAAIPLLWSHPSQCIVIFDALGRMGPKKRYGRRCIVKNKMQKHPPTRQRGLGSFEMLGHLRFLHLRRTPTFHLFCIFEVHPLVDQSFLDSHRFRFLLRYSYNGNTSVFQTEARGSIPLYRYVTTQLAQSPPPFFFKKCSTSNTLWPNGQYKGVCQIFFVSYAIWYRPKKSNGPIPPHAALHALTQVFVVRKCMQSCVRRDCPSPILRSVPEKNWGARM